MKGLGVDITKVSFFHSFGLSFITVRGSSFISLRFNSENEPSTEPKEIIRTPQYGLIKEPKLFV